MSAVESAHVVFCVLVNCSTLSNGRSMLYMYILVSLATCMFNSLFVRCARSCLRIALNCGSDGIGVVVVFVVVVYVADCFVVVVQNNFGVLCAIYNVLGIVLNCGD